MTYDELNEIILRGDPNEWLSREEFLIYKGDLNLRIEMADRVRSSTGEPFSEDWSDALPAVHPATQLIFWIHYGNTKVDEVYAVDIDQRTTVPLPDSHDHSSMSMWNYSFGKIVKAYRADYGGPYSLDRFLERVGITVRAR
jgi:hypothetical protein